MRGARKGTIARALGHAAAAAAVLAAVALAGAGSASANSCADACRNQHNQCRIQTKGNPSCDAALTQCLRSCK